MNQHGSVQVVFSANDLGGTLRLLFPEQEGGMHYAIGQDMVTTLFGLITPAAFPGQAGDQTTNTPTSVAVPGKTVIPQDAMGRRAVIAVKAALKQRGAGQGVRTLLLSETYFAALEEGVQVIANPGQSDETDNTDRLPKISGFLPIEAPYLPTANNLQGFGFRADAFAIAARTPMDYANMWPGVTGGGVCMPVTNPETGFTIMVAMFTDLKLGQTRMRYAYIFGGAVGNKVAGQLLCSK